MSNVLPAHIEDAADDLWLWENLGTRNARTEKLETYNRMMRRRDVILTNNSNLCDVEQIRNLPISGKEAAKRFKIGCSQVSRIRKGKSWK